MTLDRTARTPRAQSPAARAPARTATGSRPAERKGGKAMPARSTAGGAS